MVGVDEDDDKDVGWDATPCSADAPKSEVGVGTKASVGVGFVATPCSADSPKVGVGSAVVPGGTTSCGGTYCRVGAAGTGSVGDIGAPSGVVGAAAIDANGTKTAGAQTEGLCLKGCKS